MSETYTITKEAILKMAEACPTAKEVLRAGFPDAFKEEKKDITDQLKMEWHDHGGNYDIHFKLGAQDIGYLYPAKGEIHLDPGYSCSKGISGNCITIYKDGEK